MNVRGREFCFLGDILTPRIRDAYERIFSEFPYDMYTRTLNDIMGS